MRYFDNLIIQQPIFSLVKSRDYQCQGSFFHQIFRLIARQRFIIFFVSHVIGCVSLSSYILLFFYVQPVFLCLFLFLPTLQVRVPMLMSISRGTN